MAGEPAQPENRGVDAALEGSRQGDCCLRPELFFHVARAASQREGTPETADEGPLDEVDVHGLVVITQTCDIVRDANERPFVQVAPLVETSADDIASIQKGRRPRYAYVPGTADRRLVADLDRIMTVAKPVLAAWPRTPGCRTDGERRAFGRCVARKLTRFAFPDDFTRLMRRLRGRIQEKHDKRTEEGEALQAIAEIRALASPDWDAAKISILLLFIRDPDATPPGGRRWDEHLERWMKLVTPAGRFAATDGQVSTLEELTAHEYYFSDALDLEHLSGDEDEA